MDTRRLRYNLRKACQVVEKLPASMEKRDLDRHLGNAWAALLEIDRPEDEIDNLATMPDDVLEELHLRVYAEDVRRHHPALVRNNQKRVRRVEIPAEEMGPPKEKELTNDELMAQYKRVRAKRQGRRT